MSPTERGHAHPKRATGRQQQPEVLAFGELLWDKLPSGSVLGGAPANFASRLCSWGVVANLVSRVGRDALGDQALQKCRDLGLDTHHMQRDDHRPTGTVEVSFDATGSPAYAITTQVAYDFISCTPELKQAAKACRLIYFGTLVQRSAPARHCLHELLDAAPKAQKLLDVNLRPGCFDAETLAGSLRAANIVKVNEVEVFDISKLLRLDAVDFASFSQALFARYDVDICLVTQGAQGAFAMSRKNERCHVPGYDVVVADTIGAGDAFTAGFTFSHLRGESLHQSCETGVRCGALVATHVGGMAPVSLAQLTASPFSHPRKV